MIESSGLAIMKIWVRTLIMGKGPNRGLLGQELGSLFQILRYVQEHNAKGAFPNHQNTEKYPLILSKYACHDANLGSLKFTSCTKLLTGMWMEANQLNGFL